MEVIKNFTVEDVEKKVLFVDSSSIDDIHVDWHGIQGFLVQNLKPNTYYSVTS